MVSDRIRLLPKDLTNKIAAGEVVERPASVVKELVENAIDAGASEISIILGRGGSELIQVVDDGRGIDADDMQLAFERHATSKIRSVSDLEAIRSLGFRGEALASIASVSHIVARSVPAGAEAGHETRLVGGEIEDTRPAGGTQGTSIAVKNLFYNTPARRKFLKSDTAEYRRCLTVANRFALSYPGLRLNLVHNGELVWEVRPQSLTDRICAILGERLRNELIEVDDDAGAVKITGFAGSPDVLRKSSGEQYLFLNGRFILDKSLNHAIVSGYGEILSHGGYPAYVLQLQIDPDRVDINVHPTKMQVKFADDRLIYALLRGAVRRALVSANAIPDLGGSESGPAASGRAWPVDAAGQHHQDRHPTQPFTQADFYRPSKGEDAAQVALQLPARPASPAGMDDRSESQNAPQGAEISAVAAAGNAWQLHRKYIVSQVSSGMIIIDQHAAHERILYERALKLFEARDPASQKLLFPVMVELSADDFERFREIQSFLTKLGFAVKEFGRQTVVIEAVPSGLKIKDHRSVLQDMLDEYRRGKRENLEIRDNVAKIFSCHASIRTGDTMTQEEIAALIDQLFAAETPYYCPHGRPVITRLSLDELDKRFGRT